ncbi:DUF4260 domain-containing protein [Ancylobacter lacus]|uniref:DUF4260 domain-containing protein n=1 Tax=Ancylobacter lacus TaxID=2579970 RepID=UPI001BCCC9C7|nr:DUF4260 domain-containing protein [Ancylobacter lacus]MBS7541472.1 DUF4260 domain-containing protein [Ancylobacter lacus]
MAGTAAGGNNGSSEAREAGGMVEGAPGLLLRLEGAGVFLAALAAYAALGGGWWLFLALILAPDLGMLGYLAGPRAGAIGYNATHTYLVPLLLGGAGVALTAPLAQAVALVWVAHIGADRALGFGLKYPGSFGRTHLGLSAPARRAARHAAGDQTRPAD